tara:strand:- start:490 stop:786 length:297 start_codon:yes stop_codon:yes gene_type:complete
MEQAHLHLIKYALANGCTVSVDGGGDELDLVKSDQHQEIKDAVEAVDSATMIIVKDDDRVGWATVIIDPDMDPEETINDFSVSDFMDAWEKEYYEGGE